MSNRAVTETTRRSCPLCHSNSVSFEFLAGDADARTGRTYALFHCNQCLVTFTDLPPQEGAAANLYPETYYGEQSALNRSVMALFQSLRIRWARRASPGGKRLLDVGAGDGRFVLEAVRRGWDAYGWEPTPVGEAQACEYGVRERMFFGSAEEVSWKSNLFDLVTLWQSLEHAEHPEDVLKWINQLLSSKGRVLVSVPNQAGWAVRWFKGESFHLDVPRHRFHFTPQSLTRLLNLCGFSVIRVAHFSFEYSPFGWWQTGLNLMGLERNSLYRWLKRGNPLTRRRGTWKLLSIVATCVLSLLLLPLGFLLAVFEAMAGKGMIITVVAEKSAHLPSSQTVS